MSQEEEKTNQFFDRLAGKSPRDDSPSDDSSSDNSQSSPGIELLREALQKRIETIRAAEQASIDDLTAEEKRAMEVLKQQLIDKGLIGQARSTPPKVKTKEQVNWLQRISEFLLGSGWERPVALAASVVFAVAIGWQLFLPQEIDSDYIVRGGATPEISTNEPKVMATQLAEELRHAGAKVLVVQISATAWTIRIDVPGSANKQAIQQVLANKGIKVEGEPPYKLKVKK